MGYNGQNYRFFRVAGFGGGGIGFITFGLSRIGFFTFGLSRIGGFGLGLGLGLGLGFGFGLNRVLGCSILGGLRVTTCRCCQGQ
ncbi:MAG: hypothetical protein D6768_12500 [Chloroflexi bacterium]|nr:MAG: hypothetical protein D6768_12500 [Chloroflexota bacterium]